MPGPVLWGPNSTSNNLQAQMALSTGELIQNNGAKNYIGYNNFENALTTGFTAFSTTLTGVIPTGSIAAGDGSITLTTTATNPIAGLRSLQVDGAIPAAGQGFISSVLPIDNADQAKVLTFKFYYNNLSGTVLNFSGTSSNTLAVYIYDVTNSVWIQPAGVYGMTQGTGVGLCTGTFQTSSNGTQYRLAIINVNTTSFSNSVTYDRFFLGPQTAPIGAVITDTQSYTPTITGFGTPTNVEFFWRQVGDSIEIKGSFTAGTTTGVAASFTIPSGLTTAVQSSAKVVGALLAQGTAGADRIFAATCPAASGTVLNLGAALSGSGITFAESAATIQSSSAFSFEATVKITGWSSNVQMSSSTATNVVSSKVTKNGTQAFSVETKVTGWTIVADRAGMWDGTNNRFNIGVSGDYVLDLNIYAIPTVTAVQTVAYKINAGTTIYIGVSSGAAAASDRQSGVAFLPGLVAGDYVEVYQYTSAATTIQAGATTSASLYRLSGPAVIAATESVNCSYNTATTSVTTTPATAAYTVKVFDSHNAYNTSTGLYTVPISGKYQVNVSAQMTAGTLATTSYLIGGVAKNGTDLNANLTVGSGGSAPFAVTGSYLVSCVAGDTIASRIYLSTGTTTLAGSAANFISITRVGN